METIFDPLYMVLENRTRKLVQEYLEYNKYIHYL